MRESILNFSIPILSDRFFIYGLDLAPNRLQYESSDKSAVFHG